MNDFVILGFKQFNKNGKTFTICSLGTVWNGGVGLEVFTCFVPDDLVEVVMSHKTNDTCKARLYRDFDKHTCSLVFID